MNTVKVISCDAKECAFNQEGNCHALAITVGGGTDLVLFRGPIVVGLYRDRADAVLLADDMFDRRQVFAGQAAMRDYDNSDHEATPRTTAARIGRVAPVPCVL